MAATKKGHRIVAVASRIETGILTVILGLELRWF